MKTVIGMPSSAIRLLATFEFDKQPATRHTRMILVETYNGEYVVSAQYGDTSETAVEDLGEAVGKGPAGIRWDRSWGQGHYFDQDLEKARDYFLKRCQERR